MDTKTGDSMLAVRGLWKVFGPQPQDFNPRSEGSIDNLKRTGAVFAVRNVSFEVQRGEVFVIMGLSGSGKSTLIRCLPRLLKPTLGEIVINGCNVTEMDEKEITGFRRHETAMVFQHYGLLPHRRVIDNVAFGLKLRGVPVDDRYKKARQAINRVGLKGWEEHYPAQLSGGMRQRVGIARALVQESDLLLMDEPFSGLDPLIRREMQEVLSGLQQEVQKTIVFVTHDLAEAVRLGDRMAVMRQGEFVQQGTPEEIVNNPADEYVERFVADERTHHTSPKRRLAASTLKRRPPARPLPGITASAPLIAAERR
ncbi:MAG: betaine/proline/choline family ABC transporter ATP-binding protein [Syntrophomonadaceae bacterium]